MEAINKPSKANDYAVAKALNELIKGIMVQVYAGVGVDISKDKDIDGLNRAHILLTQELETIYSRCPELQSITPEPIWRRYDLLKGSSRAIAEYIHENGGFGDEHNLRVEKLCIIAGVDTPELNPNQRELVKSSEALSDEHMKRVKEALGNIETSPKIEYGWQITSYWLTYKPDGTILINNALKLKKVHAGSITEKLLEQSIWRVVADETFTFARYAKEDFDSDDLEKKRSVVMKLGEKLTILDRTIKFTPNKYFVPLEKNG
jgi:hypothetical protein